MSSADWTDRPVSSLSMRRIIPVRALPAPTSIKVTTPRSLMRLKYTPANPRRHLLDQKPPYLGRVLWRYRHIGDNGNNGRLRVISARASDMASAAGAMSAQWNGALTGKTMLRLAPFSCNFNCTGDSAGRTLRQSAPAHYHLPPCKRPLRRLLRQSPRLHLGLHR